MLFTKFSLVLGCSRKARVYSAVCNNSLSVSWNISYNRIKFFVLSNHFVNIIIIKIVRQLIKIYIELIIMILGHIKINLA